MSREIKFRALRENERGSVVKRYGSGDNSKWVYGNGIVPVFENTYLTDKTEMVFDVNYDELDYWQPNYCICRIQHNSVCQFTGLHDITKWDELTREEQNNFLNGINLKKRRKNTKEDWNGREIYERDIISAPFIGFSNETEIRTGVVEYMKGSFCVSWKDEKYGRSFIGYVKEIKIIGNTFENPELIQK